MNPDEIVSLLQKLGELLSPTAREVWSLAVRQVNVTAIQLVVGALVGLLILVGGMVAARRGKDMDDSYTGDVFVALGIVAAIAGTVAAVACGLAAVGRLMNPEWYAILSLGELMR